MYLKELSEKIWKTKNARFTASRKMKRRRISSTVLVAFLSASIIAVNMLAFLNISDEYKIMITVVTIVLSTFALVMSLLISQLKYEYCENNYQECGIELDNLNQRLKIRIEELLPSVNRNGDIDSPREDNEKYLDEYNDILLKYKLNHSDFDFYYSLWKAESDKDHGFWKPICLWIRWNLLDVNLLYWGMAISSIIAVVFAYSYLLK